MNERTKDLCYVTSCCAEGYSEGDVTGTFSSGMWDYFSRMAAQEQALKGARIRRSSTSLAGAQSFREFLNPLRPTSWRRFRRFHLSLHGEQRVCR